MRFWISLIIVVGLAVTIRVLKPKRPAITGLLLAYIAAIFIITLGSRRVDHVTHIGLNPVVVYDRVIRSIIEGWKTGGWAEAWKHLGWQKGQLASLGLNVLLFVPLGYLVPSITMRIDSWLKVIAFGFLFSLLIETIQLVTKLGWFDASDLLHNTVGAWIGWIVYKRWLKEKSE